MRILDVSVPDVYTQSADFRFFLKWFETSLSKVHYDTENLADIYDPLRCPSWLLWLLGATLGFKYDDRLNAAFNRLVLVYFMSMIRHKGSKDGVTLAAECNLAQFNILNYGKEKDILNDRLEDTSVPVNSVYVTPHVSKGYIDVVYFSDKVPIDACIEYVRPLGMYLIQNAGVRFDARAKISIDARLTNTNNLNMSMGPTHVGHYSREDYARIQQISNRDLLDRDSVGAKFSVEDTEHMSREDRQAGKPYDVLSHKRRNVWYRNSDVEGKIDPVQATENPPPYSKHLTKINPGYRALYSLQLCNNEHIFKSLIPGLEDPDDLDNPKYKDRERIFGLGFSPQDVGVYLVEGTDPPDYPDDYVLEDIDPSEKTTLGRLRVWNLRYDSQNEEKYGPHTDNPDVYTIEKPAYGDDRSKEATAPRPAVNPIMSTLGDAMSLNTRNAQYMMNDSKGEPGIYTPDINFYNAEPDGQLTDKIKDKDEVDDE